MAIYACEKATQLGGKVVTMSDSNGYVYDPNGIDLAYVKDLKEVRRGRIKEYAETHPSATYVADCTRIWETPCDIALPCATQNEINKASAEILVKNGCTVVCEGANMPSTPEAIEVYLANASCTDRQGHQRRRRGHFRPGDEPEQRAPELDLRGSRRPS